MATKLQLYNEALLICGERAIASLSEDRESRRLLDQVYDTGGIKRCLEAGQWAFAIRAVQIDSDPDIEPEFGFENAFTKPSDWALTAGLCSDEDFKTPLLHYIDEGDYWYAEIDPIYVRYVSDDSSYGGDMGVWPQTFYDFVAAHFARKISLKLTADKDKLAMIASLEKQAKLTALNKNRMGNPTQFPPVGSWVSARRGTRIGRRDRGSRNNLIG